MIIIVRSLVSAVIGTLCGVAWYWSFWPSREFACQDGGIECEFRMIVLGLPALAIAWTVVAWGLLRLARFSRAWQTAAAGTVGAVVLLVLIGWLLTSLDVRVPGDGAKVLVAIAAAGGYALAAAVSSGYGWWRDRAEHGGQDG